MTDRTGPLADITVIDCTMALAGPFGTALLADLGANVIKVEPPGGDNARLLMPHPPDYANIGSEESAGVDFGGYFASINRNKRSIVLDLKNPDDKERLLRLCEQADAIVENMRVGVMDKLGVGYETIRQRNAKIVYGCIRGFGDPRTGESPYANWPAFDIVAQAMGGLARITGDADSLGYPCGPSIGDLYPGTLMALGLVSAVHNARQTGEGQFFDVGMYDAIVALTETVVMHYGYTGESSGGRGQHHPNLMPFGIFAAQDGGIAIAAPAPHQWQALCEIMERPDLLDDERTANTFVRRKNQEFVQGEIEAWTSTRSRGEIFRALGGKVPCGPVNTGADIFADPHIKARGMIAEIDLPGDNPKVSITGSPIKYTRTPSGVYRRPPLHGEHTSEVLGEFGIADSDASAANED